MATDTVGADSPPLVYVDDNKEPLPLNGKPTRGIIRLPVMRRNDLPVTTAATPVTVQAQGGFQFSGTQLLIGAVILYFLLKGK